jgi:hypothetical protein
MEDHEQGATMTNATWPANKPIPTFKTAREEAEFWSKYGPSIAARSNLAKAEAVPRQRPVVVDTTTRGRGRKKRAS